MAKQTAEIRLLKSGPRGTPYAEISVDKGVSAAQIGEIVQRVTRDKDLLKKLGLKACPGCISGFHIDFRDRFDQVINVEVG
jgi:hypothetical protein